MKAVGLTNLGNIVAGSEVDYRFVALDDGCNTPCVCQEFYPLVTKGALTITPEKIVTDKHGIGECNIYIDEQASGICAFEVLSLDCYHDKKQQLEERNKLSEKLRSLGLEDFTVMKDSNCFDCLEHI